MRLELTTYRLTAGRAADCAIQELVEDSLQREVNISFWIIWKPLLVRRHVHSQGDRVEKKYRLRGSNPRPID